MNDKDNEIIDLEDEFLENEDEITDNEDVTEPDMASIDLEDLIAKTEEKILNNSYFEDCSVVYRNMNVNLRIKPISQKKFVTLTKNAKALKSADFHAEIIQECVLNKYNNEPFTMKQINEVFTGGLAMAIAFKCIEVSGIQLDREQLGRTRNF